MGFIASLKNTKSHKIVEQASKKTLAVNALHGKIQQTGSWNANEAHAWAV